MWGLNQAFKRGIQINNFLIIHSREKNKNFWLKKNLIQSYDISMTYIIKDSFFLLFVHRVDFQCIYVALWGLYTCTLPHDSGLVVWSYGFKLDAHVMVIQIIPIFVSRW